MAQQLSTPNGNTSIPGSYGTFVPEPTAANLATTGVLVLVGEADAGPHWSAETDLEANSFGPDELAEAVAKYKSGPLVDALRGAINASLDEGIPGSFQNAILVKTNVSGKAQSTVLKYDSSTYGILSDKSYGKLGNMFYYKTDAAASEVAPTTGAFHFAPPSDSLDVGTFANGVADSNSIGAGDLPASIVSTIDGFSGVTATGGTPRGMIALSVPAKKLAVTAVSGNSVTIRHYLNDGTTLTNWVVAPQAGDLIYIPDTSPISGGADQNAGSYIVTSATANTVVATKIVNGQNSSLTQPVTVLVPAAISQLDDIEAFEPITISVDAGDPIDGVGKSLEIAELTTGTGLLSDWCFLTTVSGGAGQKVSWVSTAASPKILTSATEYKAKLTVSRQSDGVQEAFTAGGDVALKVAYLDDVVATLTITSTTLTTSIAGSPANDLSLTLADYPTIADLASYINAHSSGLYKATVGTAVLGALPSTALDRVSAMGIAGAFGEYNGRVKVDAYKLFKAISASANVQFGSSATVIERAGAGLPAPTAGYNYFAGGSRGGTTNAAFLAAIDALADLDCNFIVPLISRDYGDDITDGITVSGSTYQIDSVNAAALSHCVEMSKFKNRKFRQCFLSKRDTFANNLTAAANLNSHLASLAFMDVKDNGPSGVVQFQPWMGAVKAAGLQAAGGYKAFFNKTVNTSGILQAAGDYNPKSISDQEEALGAGLLPMKFVKGKGNIFVSDQTTYSKDSNFLYNSVQAVYAANVITMTAIESLEAAFLGQSLADVDAPLVVGKMTNLFSELLRLKWVAKSDDAPRGFKNLKVKIQGGTIYVNCEVKLAGAIYFIPISFYITQVQSSAGA